VLVSLLATGLPLGGASAKHIADQIVETAPPSIFDIFLDRLMAAESSGRSHAKNPRSTALGPFQFIKTTFLDVARRHFQSEITGLGENDILAMRTDPVLSRRAAAVYCREGVKYLTELGFKPTFAHLRLAFLLGPADAARVMQAQHRTPVVRVLRPAVVRANPHAQHERRRSPHQERTRR
jgi:hypothetical protein